MNFTLKGLGEKTVPALDLNWVDTRNKKSQMKLEKLDNDLKNYKSNSIKVRIIARLSFSQIKS